MVSIREAIEILKHTLMPMPCEDVTLSQSLNRVLAEPLFSPIAVPPFDNSGMDGYALNYINGKIEYKLLTGQYIAAGAAVQHKIAQGEAVRIYTGAPIPTGANVVVPQEQVVVQKNSIVIEGDGLENGLNVRAKGSQCKIGDKLVDAGSVIMPAVIALLASVGIESVKVIRKPVVSVLVTGNELINPGKKLKYGEIYNANQFAVESFLTSMNIEIGSSKHVADNSQKLNQALDDALKLSDVIILTGGISVGDFDLVYDTLIQKKVKPLFYKVKQKPGRPLFVGIKESKVVFALPGNPAAVIACLYLYVKPSIRQLCGEMNAFLPSDILPLAHEWNKKTDFSNILKAKVENNKIRILTGQDSFNLQPFGDANALVVCFEENMANKEGDKFEIYYL